MAWQQPKTNWDTHPKAIEPADLNRIEGNIEVVRGKSDLPLRLEVVDSFPSHAPGRAIFHTGNKKAYVSDGSSWMPFASPQLTKIYTPGTTDQTIEEGYHKGSIVKGDANLKPENIVEGETIFGIVGISRKLNVSQSISFEREDGVIPPQSIKSITVPRSAFAVVYHTSTTGYTGAQPFRIFGFGYGDRGGLTIRGSLTIDLNMPDDYYRTDYELRVTNSRKTITFKILSSSYTHFTFWVYY
jgi:hypothetical protein